METAELKDEVFVCKDCHKTFAYTVWEQKLFGQRGWAKPVRCPVCRQRRRILRKALEDGVSITDQGVHQAVCARCGVQFLSILEVRKNEKEYCPNCWKEIKGF
jgi:hypothetical protein